MRAPVFAVPERTAARQADYETSDGERAFGRPLHRAHIEHARRAFSLDLRTVTTRTACEPRRRLHSTAFNHTDLRAVCQFPWDAPLRSPVAIPAPIRIRPADIASRH